MKPSKKERAVLEAFCGEPEPWDRFSGCGEATKAALLEKGWIELFDGPNYPKGWYQITSAGEAVLN